MNNKKFLGIPKQTNKHTQKKKLVSSCGLVSDDLVKSFFLSRVCPSPHPPQRISSLISEDGIGVSSNHCKPFSWRHWELRKEIGVPLNKVVSCLQMTRVFRPVYLTWKLYYRIYFPRYVLVYSRFTSKDTRNHSLD